MTARHGQGRGRGGGGSKCKWRRSAESIRPCIHLLWANASTHRFEPNQECAEQSGGETESFPPVTQSKSTRPLAFVVGGASGRINSKGTSPVGGSTSSIETYTGRRAVDFACSVSLLIFPKGGPAEKSEHILVYHEQKLTGGKESDATSNRRAFVHLDNIQRTQPYSSP